MEQNLVSHYKKALDWDLDWETEYDITKTYLTPILIKIVRSGYEVYGQGLPNFDFHIQCKRIACLGKDWERGPCWCFNHNGGAGDFPKGYHQTRTKFVILVMVTAALKSYVDGT